LAFVPVFKTLVPGVAIGLMIQLPPLCTPMRSVWSVWAWLMAGHVNPLFEAGNNRWALAERVEGLGCRIHDSISLFADACLRTLQVAFAGRSSWSIRVRGRRSSKDIVDALVAITRRTE
jgi:hypothetical protein